VEQLSRFRTSAKTLEPPQWFQVQPDSVARFRLFCFPYAGGGSAIYRPWSKQIHRYIEVVPALLPARESRLREPACTRLELLVESLTREIVPYLDRPFAFFGHSMGALISFELARRLRWERRVEPDHLFISGRRAPQLPEQDPEIHDLPEPEFLAELERLKGTPKELLQHSELMQLLVPLLRADFAVCCTYTYFSSIPLRCPITVLGGLQDESATRTQLEPWREQTTGTCRVHMLEGDHFFINQQQPAILSIITQTLYAYA
jgi:Predicted thioesterase involved in non-ribosomal peptide biosynthesis